MICEHLNEKLQLLRAKYAVGADGVISGCFLKLSKGKELRLLPWRVERRFVELKRLVDSKTLEDVSTLRFALMSSTSKLEDLLFKEFDLCEFLGESRIVRTFATLNGGDLANVLVKLADGKSCSVECSAALRKGFAPIDRHEIIARRGIACDRTVDTQIPQASIYLFQEQGTELRYTDTDAELFGLTTEESLLVRSALQVLKEPALGEAWGRAALRIQGVVEATMQCAKENVPASFQED